MELLAPHVLSKNASSVINTNDKDNAWWIYNTVFKYIDAPVLVTTCDSIIKIDLEKIYQDYETLNSPACFIIPTKSSESIEGDFICTQSNNLITSLDRENKTDLYCSGMQILNPNKINRITTPVENFKDVWGQLISQKELVCSNYFPDVWDSFDNLIQLKKIKDNE
jgi:NDP-sugar pyrophosphorylase family protein